MEALKMTDSNGHVIPDDAIKAALKQVAEKYRVSALKIKNGPYASHVTEADKEEYYKDDLRRADKIEAGNVCNFWLWQQVNEIVTGVCVPLL
jgi:hypothetical protein